MATTMYEVEQHIQMRETELRSQLSKMKAEMLAQVNAAQMSTPRDFRSIKTKDDLDHAVFKTPVDTLVNLWVAKFGTDWVDKTQVLDDQFFEWAAVRLKHLGKLEEQGFVDQGKHTVVLRVLTGENNEFHR